MISKELEQYLDEYIKKHYVAPRVKKTEGYSKPLEKTFSFILNDKVSNNISYDSCIQANKSCEPYVLDESFNDKLLRLIREKDLNEVDVYNKAGIDRRLFSKIRNSNHHLSKESALALLLALELPYEEIDDMLDRLGYSLGNSSYFDVIVKAFIEKKEYNIGLIDEALQKYDQRTILRY